MKNARVLLLLIMLLFFGGNYNHVSAQSGNYRIHTIFIYNFTKYIRWPASYETGDFVIGVFGNSPIIPYLNRLARSKSVKNQRIVIKRYRSIAEIGKCNILFITNARSGWLDNIKDIMADKPTLIITEKNGLAEKGSSINFILRNGRWRFELNVGETRRIGLKVAPQLIAVADIVG